MATPLDFSLKAPISRRHRTLLAWVLALLLHAAVIGGLAQWHLAPVPTMKAPTSLDVVLATQAAVEHEAAQTAAEASETVTDSKVPEPAPQVESPPLPAAPASPPEPSASETASEPPPGVQSEPTSEQAPESTSEPSAPKTPEASEPPQAPEPVQDSSGSETPPDSSRSSTAASGQALLAQASESVRQQGFTVPSSANTPGDNRRQAAQRAAETRYIDAWTRRVQTYGNRHYPAPSSLDGQLRIRAVIGRDGQLLQAEVIQSSGHAELDQAAMKTVEGAAPYRPFDRGMGGRDSLTITRTWRFGKGNSFGVH